MKVTEKWIKTVVVGLEFCPFARRELERDGVRMRVLDQVGVEGCYDAMLEEFHALDRDKTIGTTLLILSNCYDDFEAYLLLVGGAEAVLESKGYEGVYQLATFHPDYCFVDASPHDVANYTNRSPYPMIHILRCASVEEAIDQHPDIDALPERNVEVARRLGADAFQVLLDQCWIDEAGNRLEDQGD